MNFTEFFIRRPVFSSVLSILLLLIGLVSYFTLPLSQFPRIKTTTVSIRTAYPGASAEDIEGFVSSPIESAVAGINGLEYISSHSKNGSSKITLVFKLGYNIDQAVNDARDKVSQIQRRLPHGIDPPIVEIENPNDTPALFIAFSSDTLSFAEITDYIKRVVQSQFETIDGVSSVMLMGGRDYAMRIWLDPHKMDNQHITVNDVVDAFHNNNLLSSAGHIENDSQRFSLTAEAGLHSAEDFSKMILTNNNSHLARLEDIATVELGAVSKNSSASVNGKTAVLIGIVPRSEANQVQLSKNVKEILEEIRPQLPKNLEGKIVWDNTKFIEESIREVKKTTLEATLFVVAVMLLFLGSLRLLAIPLVTIPLSLIGICSLMVLLGFSLNTLTFLAMVLAIGLVVDDAIVVTENIQRHIENGMRPLQAAIKGAKEIQFAVISMTLTLAAVFAPIGFMGGLTGALFKEFAFTLAGAVIVSGFIALTLSPMMCAKLIRADKTQGRFIEKLNAGFGALSNAYSLLLPFTIKRRILAPIFILLIIIASFFLYKSMQNELAPKEDVGALIAIFTGPNSSNLNHTEKFGLEVSKILSNVPEKISTGVINGFEGPNSGMAFLALQPWTKRGRSVDQIITDISPKLYSLTGVSAFALNPYTLPGSQSLQPVEFILQTRGSYENLYAAAQKMLDRIKSNPGFSYADSNMVIDKPEYSISINRDRAGLLGIPVAKIAQAVTLAFGDSSIGLFSMNGHSYDVIPNLIPSFTTTPDTLNNLNVRTAENNLTPLANLVSIQQTTQPSSLNHFMQLRSAKISASLSPGYTLGQAIDFLKKESAEQLPKNITYSFAGSSRQYLHANDSMLLTFAFALIFIFLLLAAQFESYKTPFIILLTVPLSMLGALIALKSIGGTINIYTQIGFVTLVGLITKHGILIVEFANQLHSEGKSRTEAITTAAKIRLRPILMTTAAIILGAIPLALSTGAGALARQQMGWVIIGGMSFGTLLTLFIVPAMYISMNGNRFVIASKKKQ